jgi:hypothetical protein
MYFKAKSTPSKVMDLLHQAGLSMSFRWCTEAIKANAKKELEDVVKFIKSGGRPLILYDNVRITFRKETQRVNNQTHGDNGTSATLIKLPEIAAESLRNYQEQFIAKQAALRALPKHPQVTSADLVDLKAASYIQEHTIYQVIELLLATPAFSDYKHKDHPSLARPPPIHQLPTGREARTRYAMLGTWPIEESSHDGNLLVLKEILKTMNGGPLDDIAEKKTAEGGIPFVGDQLTYKCLQFLQNLRSLDGNTYDRLNWVIPSFGWFHAECCMATAILENHRGTRTDFGFARDIAQLGLKGLAGDNAKPYFHTIDVLLLTELEARIKALWLWLFGVETLDQIKTKLDYDSPTSAEELRAKAEELVRKRASTSALQSLDKQKEDDSTLRLSILIVRDLLLFAQLRNTIQQGDVGHLEYLVPMLAVFFKGSGNPQYAKLMVDYLQFSKYEAPEGIRLVLVLPSPGYTHLTTASFQRDRP